jgi:hypothetical protein
VGWQVAGIIGFNFKLNPRTAERTVNCHSEHLKQEDNQLHEGGSLSLSFSLPFFFAFLLSSPHIRCAGYLNWLSRGFCGRGHTLKDTMRLSKSLSAVWLAASVLAAGPQDMPTTDGDGIRSIPVCSFLP